jgi:hypothetical protein
MDGAQACFEGRLAQTSALQAHQLQSSERTGKSFKVLFSSLIAPSCAASTSNRNKTHRRRSFEAVVCVLEATTGSLSPMQYIGLGSTSHCCPSVPSALHRKLGGKEAALTPLPLSLRRRALHPHRIDCKLHDSAHSAPKRLSQLPHHTAGGPASRS